MTGGSFRIITEYSGLKLQYILRLVYWQSKKMMVLTKRPKHLKIMTRKDLRWYNEIVPSIPKRFGRCCANDGAAEWAEWW